MPIWLRKFTFETLKEHYEKINKSKETLEDSIKNKHQPGVTRPDISQKQPTYTAKAPTKK
jgi:hypothetical protein